MLLSSFRRLLLSSSSSSFIEQKSIFFQIQRISTIMSPTVEQEQYTMSVEEQMTLAQQERDNLEIVKKLRANPNMIEYEAYSHSSQSEKEHSMTFTALRGPGMIITTPVVFYNKTYTECTTVLHLGKNVCGHDGIIHGGLAATILDEGLASVAVPALPNKIGFTANLNVNYRKPIKSDQWVVMKSKLDKIEDRKAYVSAFIESLDGQLFTEATSLYISPKIPITNNKA
ncbi:HotDog domain-containing protein [Cokeromyces recurvatus]|uniref:HotDog domain-containing protein n=1 Tax=Cokeromyces recurvatus TaxID=90255 RepID=UPI00221EB3C7|nr:HotDog domain-containing protein [Cokeromyces recurvatus]KAI7898561.1 HotDog domain-containing protein [Cokeromyces recurvatus]